MISSSREADASGVNRIGRTRSPAGPLPRIAIETACPRSRATVNSPAAHPRARYGRRGRRRVRRRGGSRSGQEPGVRRLIGVGMARGLGPAQPAPGSVRNAAAAVWRSQGQVLTRGTGGAAHRRAVLHRLLRAPLVRGARTESQERQNPRQLARSQHGILLSARRRGQKRAGRKDGKDEKDLMDEKLISSDVLGVLWVLSCRGGIRISKALFWREEEYEMGLWVVKYASRRSRIGDFWGPSSARGAMFRGFWSLGRARANREGRLTG